MEISKTIGDVDTAKRVFQLYWVDMETGEEMTVKLGRAKFLRRFANHVPCLVAMESCGGSQHWARELLELGHEVGILPVKMVRPFVRGNKNDTHDAKAMWTAVQRPGVRTVAVKKVQRLGCVRMSGGLRSDAIDCVPARRQGEAGLGQLSVRQSGCVAALGTGEQSRRLRSGMTPRGHNPALPSCVKPSRTVFCRSVLKQTLFEMTGSYPA